MASSCAPVLDHREDLLMPQLVDVPELACGESAGNLVVHGDNLLALRELASTHSGAVRCVYLDPPYNTGNTLEHYLDGRAHDAWLDMMRERLLAIVPLLGSNGVVLAQTDRRESAYLKVLLDDVFGRAAYVTTIAVRMSGTSGFKIEHTDRTIVKNTEYLHVYSSDLHLEQKAYEEARGFDDHYALLLSDDAKTFSRLVEEPDVAQAFAAIGLPARNTQLAELYRRSGRFRRFVAAHADRVCRSHTAPGPARRSFAEGTLLAEENGRSARVVQREYAGSTYHVRRTRNGVDQLIPIALKMHPVDTVGGPDRLALTNILGDWWDGFHLDMGNVEQEGAVLFKCSKKPERLIRRILGMFTRPDDVVLDPFGGSGTTAAVAHKMGRRWITIEQGPHALSHLVPRIRRVVQGDDPTGVTASTGWRGGGGFSVQRLKSLM
jgi:adenine-specific DNA-methyltransferase